MLQKICKAIVNCTMSEKALLIAICIQATWMIVGTITHLDPWPYLGMLTVSNVLQLILIFAVGVAQRQANMENTKAVADSHAELRVKFDDLHDKIANSVHNKLHDSLLAALHKKTD